MLYPNSRWLLFVGWCHSDWKNKLLWFGRLWHILVAQMSLLILLSAMFFLGVKDFVCKKQSCKVSKCSFIHNYSHHCRRKTFGNNEGKNVHTFNTRFCITNSVQLPRVLDHKQISVFYIYSSKSCHFLSQLAIELDIITIMHFN